MDTATETQYVHSVYSLIARSFDKTRYKPWNIVRSFLETVPAHTSLLDIGCGNGKNLHYMLGHHPHASTINAHGCDITPELIAIASQKCPTAAAFVVANCTNLPYASSAFDTVLCTAVLHHLSTRERRRTCIREIIRVLRPNGRALISVWATSAHKPSWEPYGAGGAHDFLVPWKKETQEAKRFYHLYTEEELISDIKAASDSLYDITIDIQSTFECDNWHALVTRLTLQDNNVCKSF